MLRFNNKLIRINGKETTTGPVSEPAETVVTVGNQYGWKVPIDLILDWSNNGIEMVITAYTTQADMDSWDHGSDNRFFAVRTNGSNEYNVLSGFVNFSPIDSTGYRGMTFTNTNFSNANLNNILTWKGYGDTHVVFHSPAAGTDKFLQPPLCMLNYNGESTVIKPIGLGNL